MVINSCWSLTPTSPHGWFFLGLIGWNITDNYYDFRHSPLSRQLSGICYEGCLKADIKGLYRPTGWRDPKRSLNSFSPFYSPFLLTPLLLSMQRNGKAMKIFFSFFNFRDTTTSKSFYGALLISFVFHFPGTALLSGQRVMCGPEKFTINEHRKVYGENVLTYTYGNCEIKYVHSLGGIFQSHINILLIFAILEMFLTSQSCHVDEQNITGTAHPKALNNLHRWDIM